MLIDGVSLRKVKVGVWCVICAKGWNMVCCMYKRLDCGVLYVQKVGVWCAMCATKIIGPFFLVRPQM
jgi:hypothetical protein